MSAVPVGGQKADGRVQPLWSEADGTIHVTGAVAVAGTVDQGNPNAGGVLAWPVTDAAVLARLDVALSTRASEATLATRASEATVATLATQATVTSILVALGGGLPAALVGARLDTNLGAWLGATTPTVGQKTMVASIPVAIASDQGSIPVGGAVDQGTGGASAWLAKEQRAATSAVTRVASSAVNVTLLALNAARLGVRLHNDSTNICYVKFGTTATATDFTIRMNPQDFYADDLYTGRIDGIWSAANGGMQVTELTA